MSWCKQCDIWVNTDLEWEYDDGRIVYYDVCSECGTRIEK